jgi:hypothetical protein
MKLKSGVVLLCFLSLGGISFGSEVGLKKVWSIGSDKANYLFFSISSARIGSHNDIFVADSQGSFIRKYDKNGVFVKEIGRHGQGPGDFGDSINLFWDKKLFALDGRNSRIAVLDEDLNIASYVRIAIVARKIIRINNLFYCNAGILGSDDNQIVVLDEAGGIINRFHDELPDYLVKVPRSKLETAMKIMHSGIEFDCQPETNEIVATYRDPGKNIEIFVYSNKGALVRKLSLNHLIDYEYPKFMLEWPIKYPPASSLVTIKSIHSGNPRSVFVNYIYSLLKETKGYETRSFLIKIDIVSGKVMDKIEIDSKLEILDIEGSLVCTKYFGDETQELRLYELK